MKRERRNEATPRGPGRPPEGGASIPVTIKLKPGQPEKLKRLGGPEWVRKKIDQAKEPT